MKKVVSLSLFGEGTRYAAYLAAFARAHLTLFPQSEGWELRVHVDAHNKGGFLGALERRGLVRLVECEPAPLTLAMLWRMKPVWDEAVDYVFPRDLDALPTPRDRACCDRFIESGCDVQMVHDSRSHDGIMGGMGGYACESFREIVGLDSWEALVDFGSKTNDEWARHGTDQVVLNRLILGWGRPEGALRPNLAIFEHRYTGWAAGRPGTENVRRPNPVACVSEPVPDGRLWGKVGGASSAEADALCGHIGAAGFDTAAAIAFYDKHGDPSVIAAIRDAEASL